MKTKNVLLLLALLITISCKSVDRMIDQGNFDAALVKSARKLSGKKKLKTKYVTALEEAFARVTNRDMQRIESLFDSRVVDDQRKILSIYAKMGIRQERISAFLPLVSKDGYRAQFRFVELARLVNQTEEKLIRLLKEEAISDLAAARLGNKMAARTAYRKFGELLELRPTTPEIRSLRKEAESMGIVHVGVGVINHTRHLLPRYLERQILSESLPESHWLTYADDAHPNQDFSVSIVLHALEVSPERILEAIVERSKEIEDGFDYVLDENGNVLKDTLGNDVKVPRYAFIEAQLLTTEQSKKALLAGEIICRDLKTREVDHLPIQSEVFFENAFSDFRGDRRALLAEDRQLLGQSFAPFPTDEAMFDQALRRISPAIRSKISATAFL